LDRERASHAQGECRQILINLSDELDMTPSQAAKLEKDVAFCNVPSPIIFCHLPSVLLSIPLGSGDAPKRTLQNLYKVFGCRKGSLVLAEASIQSAANWIERGRSFETAATLLVRNMLMRSQLHGIPALLPPAWFREGDHAMHLCSSVPAKGC
jgi:hypothetical protein